MKKSTFNARGLTSFFMTFGFLVMSVTGIILYFEPQGRVAYWVTWRFLGLTKTDWDNIHILSSLLFVVAGIFHLYFNWKPLMHYLRDKVAGGIRLKREFAVSIAGLLIVVVSALYHVPPVGYLLDFNEYLKGLWVFSPEYEPPFGHAELLSLKVFTKKMDIDLTKAKAELNKNGIKIVSDTLSLEEIARANNVSPKDLYMIIKKYESVPNGEFPRSYTPEEVELEFAGSNLGSKTLKVMCAKTGVDMETAQKRLAVKGYEMSEDDTFKKVADRYGVTPMDILKTVLVAEK